VCSSDLIAAKQKGSVGHSLKVSKNKAPPINKLQRPKKQKLLKPWPGKTKAGPTRHKHLPKGKQSGRDKTSASNIFTGAKEGPAKRPDPEIYRRPKGQAKLHAPQSRQQA
jgi:hypothetical protein